MTNEEWTVSILGDCRCNKIYKIRGKVDPDCDYCGHGKEFIEALTQVRNDAIEEVMEEKMFPMQDGPNIPWSLAETIYAGYSALYGTDQSLDRIAERHGFGWAEVAYLYKRERFRKAIEALKDGDK